MKDLRARLIRLFKEGYCAPQIGRIAKELEEPSATIHYNIKKMEREGAIRAYKAVFDYSKVEEGFCAYVLIALAPDEFATPEKVAEDLARHAEVESADIVAGDWEIIVKVRARDQEGYFNFLKNVISKERGIMRSNSIVSLKQVKTEFVRLIPPSPG